MAVTLTKCENCDKSFEAKRSTARFCSTKCRVYNKRGLTPIEKAFYTPTPEKIKQLVETKAATESLKLCRNNHILNWRGYCDVKGCK